MHVRKRDIETDHPYPYYQRPELHTTFVHMHLIGGIRSKTDVSSKHTNICWVSIGVGKKALLDHEHNVPPRCKFLHPMINIFTTSYYNNIRGAKSCVSAVKVQLLCLGNNDTINTNIHRFPVFFTQFP